MKIKMSIEDVLRLIIASLEKGMLDNALEITRDTLRQCLEDKNNRPNTKRIVKH